ncbi:MAG TPA: ABC transporter ATP-binding protein [Solirubrobacteraceae bacterium]|nr:ABC transporter ATP-binding protein [Solirubrobacteraceae bacterium]
MAEPRLRIDDVSCAFDHGNVIESIDLDVGRGEFVSIVGPSGSGKSTLFNIVSGLIRPTAGRVLLDGQDVTGERGHVGYMLQKDLLLPWRTVVGNIVLGAALRGSVKRADRVRAAELATRYGLGEFLNHYPRALSGGMRQRVAFMRTLALESDLLLLDEPFGALDAQTRLEMQMWLLSVCQDVGATILFITHDVDEAIFLSDRVVVFTGRPGRIAADLPIRTPRPRGLDDLTTPEFIERKREALALLHRHEYTRTEA